MKNAFLEKFETTVAIKVEGKNIERFLRRLYEHKIAIIKLWEQTHKSVKLKIRLKDLEKVEELKTIYTIAILRYYGKKRIREWFYKNRFLLLFLVIGYLCLLLLTNTIFEIEVIHNDPELREMLREELASYGIEPKHLKKSFQQLEKIKKEILEKHKDQIEWLEIISDGTRYIVRVEERILNQPEEEGGLQNIIATKSAIIKKVVAKSGEIVKNINDYVKPGDVVISSDLKIYEETKNQIRAEGTVYGEVWYKVQVEYPLHYYEEKATGKKKTIYSIHFLNHHFNLFDFHPFREKKEESKVLLQHNLLPFTFVREKQTELEVIDQTYTKEEAVQKAIEEAKKKIEASFHSKEEHVISTKELQVDANDSRIIVDIFVTVYEDITGSVAVSPMEQPKEE